MKTRYRGPIVAIYGPIGCGKTTTADYLAGSCGFTRVSFADALRDEAAHFLMSSGVIPIEPHKEFTAKLRDPATKETYRGFLQWLGTYRRETNPDYWIDSIMDTVYGIVSGGDPVVIDDCRYHNEYLALRRHGALFVLQHSKPDTVVPVIDHPSEQDWPDFYCDLALPWATIDARAKEIIELLTRHRLLDPQ